MPPLIKIKALPFSTKNIEEPSCPICVFFSANLRTSEVGRFLLTADRAAICSLTVNKSQAFLAIDSNSTPRSKHILGKSIFHCIESSFTKLILKFYEALWNCQVTQPKRLGITYFSYVSRFPHGNTETFLMKPILILHFLCSK